MRKPRRLSADELAPYMVELGGPRATGGGPDERPALPLDWTALFGNAHPVEVEVGMGKGLFLVTTATARPDTNFFGVEIVRKYQLYVTQRIAVRKLANARTCCADAGALLRDRVADESVAAVHVYFPDPWWKTRHHKRRVFTPAFAATAARVIAPGGVLHIATDVPAYFDVMAGIVRGMPAFRELPPPADNVPAHDMDYMTNFERKARKKGVAINRARFERVG